MFLFSRYKPNHRHRVEKAFESSFEPNQKRINPTLLKGEITIKKPFTTQKR